MLFHLSIDADNPRQVARVFAEIWGGIATPFPAVINGSWIALAGDARNTAIEVYPRGTELVEAEGDQDAIGVAGGTVGNRSATHMAVGTDLGPEAVFAIAAHEGWPAKYRKRGDAFGVIELWVEGSRMVEILPPAMQGEYLGAMTIEGWTGYLRSIGILGEGAPGSA